MIARIWHGKTKLEDYDNYTTFLKKVAVPVYKKTNGFLKLTFLRNTQSSEGHFTLITFWENMEVIKNFAGKNYEKAKYCPEDDNFLFEFEEEVAHHEVFAEEHK